MRAATLEDVAATTTTAMSLSDGSGRPDQVTVATVTSNLWIVLGVSPTIGRPGFPAYDAGEEARLVVLSHGLWERRFGGDAAILGTDVRLDGEAYTVTAIMPPEVRTLDDVIAASIALPRFNLQVLGAFALVALLLAAAGLYSVLTYTVQRRRAEIGVRMALGASAGTIVRMVVGDGLRLVALGVVLGIAGALAASRLLSGLLHGIAPTDPATYALIVCVLAVVATLAATLPARRAVRLDPVAALRQE